MKMAQIYSKLISDHRNASLIKKAFFMSKATGKILSGARHWQTFFMTHKQGGDEVEGLLSAKFEEEIK